MEHTQWNGNVFPGLSWSPGPAGTWSYVIVMQDGDALREGVPILHWTMVNIPVGATALDAAMTTAPERAQHGPSVRGADQPYAGPRTPPGPRHRYHFQLFALDTALGAETLVSYAALMDAMHGHVLASGETVGLGEAPNRGRGG